MNDCLLLSQQAKQYYSNAEKSLAEKDLLGFMENIGIAKIFSDNDEDSLSAVTFLKVLGLYRLGQYKGVISSVQDALNYNTGDRAVKIRNLEGVSFGFVGEYDTSKEILVKLLDQTQDLNLLVETYLNLVWVNLILVKEKQSTELLEEVKTYLDAANEHFDCISNFSKRKLLINYSVHCFYKQNFEEAINLSLKAIDYSSEEELPEIYNNLADIYLEAESEGISVDVNKYLREVEIIGTKYKNTLELAKGFYTNAMISIRSEEYIGALDYLYLALEHFRDANAFPYAFDCLTKINDIIAKYNNECISSVKERVNSRLKDLS